MPKPMPMLLLIEEIAFGKVFRLLSDMPGVVNINIDADTIGQKRKGNNPGAKHSRGTKANGATAICAVLRELKKGPAPRKALEAAIEAIGKKAGTLNGQIFKMKAQKLVKNNGRGSDYSITAKGESYLAEACGGA